MNVQVVSDDAGRIVSLSMHGDTGPSPSGIANAGVILDKGQRLHALDVPTEFEARSLVELTEVLRVDLTGSSARLVAATTPQKRAPTKRPRTKRAQASKSPARKTRAKKTAAKKTAAKKTAAKKTAAKKTAAGRRSQTRTVSKKANRRGSGR
jgi:hypothetical protein